MQAIHGIQPPSKLEAIINDGLQRIDDAVEAVIAKHCPYEWADSQKILNMSLRRVADEMSLAAPKIWPTDRPAYEFESLVDKFTINTDVMVQGNIDPNAGIPRYHKALPHEIEGQAQRKRNYETALRNEMNNVFGKGFI